MKGRTKEIINMKRVSLASLPGGIREFFANLQPEETPLVVEDNGRAVAAIVPPWQLDTWEENQRRLDALLAQLRAANREVPPEQIEADIDAALREIRLQPVA